APIEIYLAGRATDRWRGTAIPIHDIAIAACREVFAQVLPMLELNRQVRIISRLRPGSTDLRQLFARSGSAPLANDTSCGVGFAPLTELERVVLQVERRLNSAESRRAHPELGPDIKVLGTRRGRRIDLTLGCAFVSRHVAHLADYFQKKELARGLV